MKSRVRNPLEIESWNLVRSQPWVRKQESKHTSQHPNGSAGCHVYRMHDGISFPAFQQRQKVHYHNLTQRYPLHHQPTPLRQPHHKCTQRHRCRHVPDRQSRRSYHPQAQYRRANTQHRCVSRLPAGPHGVSQRRTVDNDDDSGVRKCRELYLAAE